MSIQAIKEEAVTGTVIGSDVDTYASIPGVEVARPAEVDPLLSAPIVAALERAWATIRHRHPDLPAVVMVLASGSDGAPAGWLKLGPFAAMRWETRQDVMAEVFVGGDAAARGRPRFGARPGDQGHQQAGAVSQPQVRRAGPVPRPARGADRPDRLVQHHHHRRHPQRVRDHHRGPDRGSDDLPAQTDLFAGTGAGDDGSADGGDATRAPRRPSAPARPGSNGVVAYCSCARRIRITASVLVAGPIACGLCGDPFTTATN